MEEIKTLQSVQYDLLKKLTKSECNFRKTPKERLKPSYLETRLEIIDKHYMDFKQGHNSIVKASVDKKEQYFADEIYDTFEELYVEYKTVLKDALQSYLVPKVTPTMLSSGTAPALCTESNDVNNFDVKLPRINLPIFSGKYEEWQTFHDMFTTVIHDNKHITSVQKLHYLKGHITGEPQNLLRNYTITEANYEEAWMQLVRRYNNKRYNCNAILRNLFAIKKISNESANAIKQLLDTASTCLKSLTNMGINTESWDAIIVYLVVSRLDAESMRLWEQHLNTKSDDLPTWGQLQDYLENRFRSLEMIDANINKPVQPTRHVTKSKAFHASIENKKEQKSMDMECAMCHGNHYIYHCKQFELMVPKERQEYVQNHRLCFNCLSPTHAVMKCRRPLSCRKCARRHHTLLHFETSERDTKATSSERSSTSVSLPSANKGVSAHIPEVTNLTSTFSREELQPNNVLLATALIKVHKFNGFKIMFRALLDQGSQASFITEATVQLLGLKRKPVSGWVSGLGDGRTRITHTVSFKVESRHNSHNSILVYAYVLRSLTSFLPATKLSVPESLEIENLPLADPTYATPGNIDILLGADVYCEVLQEGIIKQSNGSLIAQNTLFGWILSGKIGKGNKELAKTNIMSMHVQIKEDELLKMFWEIENEPTTIKRKMTKSEELCEEFFDLTTERDEDGRFVVKLPFTTHDPKCQYGHSMSIAIKRLHILERKLLRDAKLRNEYNNVMHEYLTLNHMTLVEENELRTENTKAVYLPHHAVVRDDKETTKVRIVFDASSKGTNDVSLNDDLLVGPKLQQDLRHILMRWRSHRVCIIADIVKMYRMIRVADKDTDFQRIVWRFTSDGSEPIQHYRLLRLTFGTACAPYLAVKCLHKLADLEKDKYPLAASITKSDYYMDDLISGAENVKDALMIYEEMNGLMNSGGFTLQKWNSNSNKFIQEISNNEEKLDVPAAVKFNKSIKVLGVSWNRDTDTFQYMLNLPEFTKQVTKRQVLSDVAKLYDPLGWIAPVVVTAKILIQKLWKSQLEWDDYLNEDLLRQWLSYRKELVDLQQLQIPRWLDITRSSKIELHVFSDASKTAYAAAVYIRVIDERGQVYVHLVTAKTKVAPIEREISIPRLELCGAALAAKLIFEVSEVMNISKDNLYGWTDSTIVLAWLKGGSAPWTTFVSNRVSTVLNILEFEQWSHVPSELNPADCASRGLQVSDLLMHKLWWNGPCWLGNSTIDIEKPTLEDTQEEAKIQVFNVTSGPEEDHVWLRFSSLSRLLRVLSYCRRILNLKLPREDRVSLPKYITSREINTTLLACIKVVQELEFTSEIKALKKQGAVPRKSNMRTLCPFLDEKGVLRVGGRIDQSDASYDMKHPIIMPAKNHFTMLLIVDAHHKTLHGGPQIMLNFLRAKYWILRAKERVKKCYRECVICLKNSMRKSSPLMGLLPEARLKPSKPFKSSGLDYCGPIKIRFSPGRGARSYKGYICLYVCMVTRAVHLEAVTDLTSKGFIAAFRRFTARRGHCQDLYSDNGTNFVGADREMRDMLNNAKSELPEKISALLSLEGTTWHFIPPHSPNFGGLWEAGVRSTKTHLRKVIGTNTLTYEEISTVLAQVEACLNSRPLSLLRDDPSDPLPLTPGHFLVGEPLINIADNDYTTCNVTGLDRWRLTQKIVQDFWKRWYKEYLVNLNQRYKWTSKCTEPEIGDIVVLKEDNIPPAKWILGKIVAKHPGPDNVTRVVSVQCKSGILKRPMSKVCVLTK